MPKLVLHFPMSFQKAFALIQALSPELPQKIADPIEQSILFLGSVREKSNSKHLELKTESKPSGSSIGTYTLDR